jgi:chromate transport protein ChrA
MQMSNPVDEPIKIAGDIVSVTTVIGTLAGVLPSIAALFTIVWTAIRIYETETVQGFLRRMKE